MASFVIEGGHRLCGEIHPQGAKNEALQIICATLLTAEEVTVNNIPDILDVNNLIQLLREMGVTVAKKGIDSYSFKAENVDLAYLESDDFLKKCSSLRGSVMLIGPMVEVCPLSRRVTLKPLSRALHHGIRFLHNPLPAPHSAALTIGHPSVIG